MDSFKRHGGLLVDELKLSEHLFVISAATFEGLVDLGRFTPKSEKCEPCDHGMVIMFAPFTGKWTQILAVFATHGNVKGELLAKLLVEAVLLAEDAGLLVDFVTCEGATWNRKMWKVLGIGATSASIKCRMRHPKDGSHYLHFLSDFPQLVKCLRNNLLSHNFDTPDGWVSLDIVKNVYDMDGSAVTLRLMHGIREAHLNPNNFEKMRITMIHSIITIMSSRHPRSALRMNSTAADCLTAFLAYVTEWEVLTKGTRGFMSQSTATGLRVTIKSTLLPLEYLTVKMGYQYLMTSRLNQDPLESTFGIVRQCSGNNDHPTPQQFLDTMSCLSFSNLVRLPDKGNVGPNTVQSLLSPKMCRRSSSQKPGLAHELANVPFIGNEEELNNFSNEDDHAAYISARSDRRLVHYMGGAGPADVASIRDVVSIFCLEQVKTECPREICVLCRSSLQASASKDEMLLRLGLRPAEPALGAHTGSRTSLGVKALDGPTMLPVGLSACSACHFNLFVPPWVAWFLCVPLIPHHVHVHPREQSVDKYVIRLGLSPFGALLKILGNLFYRSIWQVQARPPLRSHTACLVGGCRERQSKAIVIAP
ncbi:hypothetical protein HPB49_025246 [Dermacentor silvarum]|uniref:Uncharacterized protein n=1 Tax=Dermacentor silvarum TaxID=543639 RepID=A0ACB8D138_DERSI|nr:hypothetical protein HPB49_025246 [Dermacentor silvarum]